MSPAVQGRRGFTLLELVVSLTISGLAISAGYAALALVVDRREALARETELVARSAAVRGTLVAWLEEARVDATRLTPSISGLDGERDGVADDRLTFLTTATTPLDVARTLVSIGIARDSAGQSTGLVAELRDWDGPRVGRVVLDSTVATLDLTFQSTLVSGTPTTTSWTSTSVLPLSVEIRLSPRAGMALPPLLGLPLLVAFEGGR